MNTLIVCVKPFSPTTSDIILTMASLCQKKKKNNQHAEDPKIYFTQRGFKVRREMKFLVNAGFALASNLKKIFRYYTKESFAIEISPSSPFEQHLKKVSDSLLNLKRSRTMLLHSDQHLPSVLLGIHCKDKFHQISSPCTSLRVIGWHRMMRIHQIGRPHPTSFVK